MIRDEFSTSFWRDVTWRNLAWRVAALLGAAFLLAGVIVSLFVGSCGFAPAGCSTTLSDVGREDFSAALNLSVGVGPLLLLPFTRDLVRLLVAGSVSFGATLAVIVLLWP